MCFAPPGLTHWTEQGSRGAWHLRVPVSQVWAATGAGLGVTLRTTVGLPGSLAVLKPGASGLPRLPKVVLTLCKTKADSAVNRLSEILRETIAEQTEKG